MAHIVEIKNLRKEYPKFILDGISLEIPQGYITGIIGPNGAGKSGYFQPESVAALNQNRCQLWTETTSCPRKTRKPLKHL